MASGFNLLLDLFAGAWLCLAALMITGMLKPGRKTNALVVALGLLAMIGFAGFFGEMLSAVGEIRLSNSTEWPAGYVTGVRTTASGKYVVPLVPQGRVQIYDSKWHFLRGWNVDALGGSFKVAPTAEGTINVFAARGKRRFTFSEDGVLISAATMSEQFDSLSNEGQTVIVPTAPLLWVFSSPAISWGVGAIGFIGLVLVKKFAHGMKD
jgi:hypothetical protein